MKIALCIKQVPDVKDIQWTQNNTMKREGVESVINNCDLYAIETALNIKKEFDDTQIYVFSMGPKQAEKAIRQAIALGCDEGFLICDKKFSGSDTLATSTTLSVAIKNTISDFDLIICGQFASDGDTAQTGAGIAQNLEINQVTYVKDIIEITNDYIIVKKEDEKEYEYMKTQLPALICVMEDKEKQLSNATISGQITAQDAQIKIINWDNLKLEETQCGIKGSPTYVSNVFRPKQTRTCEVINSDNAVEFVRQLITDARNK